MASVTIPERTYLRLQAIAAAMHIPLDKLLDRVATENEGVLSNGHPTLKPGTVEWAKAFNAWVASHPPQPFTADDSRDVIYGEERD